jgi:hypothetical protein
VPSSIAVGPRSVRGAKAAQAGAIVNGYSTASTAGVVAATCRLAASATGPAHACGTTRAPNATAVAAIRRASVMPPHVEASGCSTDAWPRVSTSTASTLP